jgi:hypothetical protein
MKPTRRGFLQSALALATGRVLNSRAAGYDDSPSLPWYRSACRWGQTNITEKDPVRYDINWWRHYWKKTEIQGVIINAGGIVAYYPSRFPLHYRAEFLGGRDLFGELLQAAHEDGLAVLARMDSNRTNEAFYQAHPDWFTRDGNDRPYRAADKYITCINSPYYEEYLPEVLGEIIEKYHPEGITDNSWAGLNRDSVCYCSFCRKKFLDSTGEVLPSKVNWDDTIYRKWVQWNYQRRLEIWDLNNRVTQKAGGPHCLWIGMNSGSIAEQSRTFRDHREICRRAEILLLDHQTRNENWGFPQNSDTGKLTHQLLGWDKMMPESMALYQAGRTPFRLSSKPAAEARLWMLEGIAGGIQPWWHHVGAYHEDRRMYRTAEPLFRWHKKNQTFLLHRKPVATVGLGWSQRNTDYYGRDQAEELVDQPYRGFLHALVRARVPFVPVHLDDLDKQAEKLSLFILPNLAVMSSDQCAAVRRFAGRGGSVIATGVTSLYDGEGIPRKDFALADLWGAHLDEVNTGKGTTPDRNWALRSFHSYLRLSPELRGRVDGPQTSEEPAISGGRHPILQGLEETDILPFGGMLSRVQVDAGTEVLFTLIPPFPVYPPETAWMREPKTTIPGLILSRHRSGGRLAFMPADLDRRFARDYLPDHGNLLANLVRWAVDDHLPFQIEGAGLLDCHLYEQPGRLILHLINLTNPGTWRAPVDELFPVGPVRIKIRLTPQVNGKTATLLVADQQVPVTRNNGWINVELNSILDHEVVFIE